MIRIVIEREQHFYISIIVETMQHLCFGSMA